MEFLTCFTAFALVVTVLVTIPGLLPVALTSNEEYDKVLINKQFYAEDFVKYKAEHDIVNLIVPLNSLNFDKDYFSSFGSKEVDSDIILFFVLADALPNGNYVNHELYVLKDGKAKVILDYGRDAAASGDDSKLVFFGAKYGLYVYNQTANTAEKYGSLTDSIIAIEKEKAGDVIYILTEDRDVYKVSNYGETKVKLDDVVNAKEIVLDYSDNLYFISDDNKPYVRTADGVNNVEGLPDDLSDVKLIKPPFFLDSGAPFIVNNKVYVLYANGSSELTNFEFTHDTLPTALAPEAALFQYYAYDKKIFEYNVPNILEQFRKEVVTEIGNIWTHSKLKLKGQA